MEEKKTKKKKLTLSVSLKKPYNISSYKQDRQKTSVVIEKKTSRKWGEKRTNYQNNNFNKPNNNFVSKKPQLKDLKVLKRKKFLNKKKAV